MTEPATTLTLALDGGGTARLVEVNGERATFESTRAFPPGSPLVGRAEDGSGEYRLKVRSSRRRAPNTDAFEVEGRFINLTRAQRDRLTG